jgi:hypothetical protein
LVLGHRGSCGLRTSGLRSGVSTGWVEAVDADGRAG